MGLKGLRVAYERLGPERDPNAPHNRPKFSDPPPADGENIAPEGLVEDGEAVGADTMLDGTPGVPGRVRRTSRPRRDLEEGSESGGGGEPGEDSGIGGSSANRGKVRRVLFDVFC